MNKCIGFTVLAMVIASAGLSAAERSSPDDSTLAAASMAGESSSMDAGKMQEKMLRMHEQMHKIMRTKDGLERERLLQEHRNMLEENMRLMQGMKGDCNSQKEM